MTDLEILVGALILGVAALVGAWWDNRSATRQCWREWQKKHGKD